MKTIKLSDVEIKILELGLDWYIGEYEECYRDEQHKDYLGKIQLAYDIKDKLKHTNPYRNTAHLGGK